MKSKLTILSAMLFLAMAAPCFAESTDEKQAVTKATAQFYKSLNVMFTGDATPMLEVWSHADDVTYMGPAGGFQTGWKQVEATWEYQAALKLGGEITAEPLHTTVGQDLAVVLCREVGSNLDAQGNTVQVSIRATNIFRKENGEWKMIGHHTDLLPFLEQSAVSVETE